MYAIYATVETYQGGSRSVPLFYLDPMVQGIVSAEHACRIAISILTTMLTPNHSVAAINVDAYASHDNADPTAYANVRREF